VEVRDERLRGVETYTVGSADLLERRVEEFHELGHCESRRDIADVELSLRFVVVGEPVSRVVLFIVRQDFLGGHAGSDLVSVWRSVGKVGGSHSPRSLRFELPVSAFRLCLL